MPYGKMRNRSQIIGETAINILKKQFPSEWVIREYTPDYGIDLAIEIFEQYENKYITTGEHVYFQVKGTESLQTGTIDIYERDNVEKSYSQKDFFTKMNIIKFQIDTALLSTVEKMGSAVPVLLLVVDIREEITYFVCLNDYIEKVILPNVPNYAEQQTITIHIPITNAIHSREDIRPINWYAKRAKLFALFNKANYQASEIEHISDNTLANDIIHYAKILRRLDAWSASPYFYPLKSVQNELDYFLTTGITPTAEMILAHLNKTGDINEQSFSTNNSTDCMSLKDAQNALTLRTLWGNICNCGFILEDISKEWFLPTYAGVITSS